MFVSVEYFWLRVRAWGTGFGFLGLLISEKSHHGRHTTDITVQNVDEQVVDEQVGPDSFGFQIGAM